jgi:general secretion pathway protein D
MNTVIFKRKPTAIISIAICSMLAGATGQFSISALAQPAPVAAQAGVTTKRGDPITLNFTNAEIDAVARTMATLTGRNVVVDPRVKGTITLTTDKPVTPAQAYTQFLAMLRLQGFTVVDAAGLDKIVPEADAKLQGGAVFDNTLVAGNQISTQIFKLNFENANNLLPILRPLISPNNTINVNPGNNSLVITDYGDNLRRMAQIIAAMDVSNATDVDVISLKHAIAVDLAPLVQRLLESSGGAAAAPGGAADSSFKTTLIAEPRSNTLILRAANPARMALARSLIDKLDQPGTQNAAGNIYVVYLKNAEATKLAATLRAAMSGEARGSTSTASSGTSPVTAGGGAAGATGGSGSTATSQSTTGGQIQADAATNSLVITAPEPQYRQLRAVIDKLDTRRAQVYVESLIVEVNASKAAEFGIQWQGPMGKAGDGTVGILGTNFSIGGTNIVNLATKALSGGATLATGGNLAVANQVNGVYVLGFLARYLQENGDGNVLSTPNLLTLDNEEAKIVIAQNVPFVTGQFTNTGAGGNSGSVNPFQTIERKDVGITLKFKPQISENGTVKMTIYQEVSTIQPDTKQSANGPTTNKRTIESNVLVEDGSIVVLGGLLSDEYSGNQEKVPGFGDLPVFGNLFKSETRSRKKTNLMVFLRPVVVRDAAATNALSLDRYELMRGAQQQVQPAHSMAVPVNESVIMPQVPKSTTTPASALIAPAVKP